MSPIITESCKNSTFNQLTVMNYNLGIVSVISYHFKRGKRCIQIVTLAIIWLPISYRRSSHAAQKRKGFYNVLEGKIAGGLMTQDQEGLKQGMMRHSYGGTTIRDLNLS